ncbi:hypothetical protein RHSA111115_03680 [Rheinheimera salexigens]
MRSGFCRALLIVLFCLSFASLAAGYEVFSDDLGNIYLKAPHKLIVVPQQAQFCLHRL